MLLTIPDLLTAEQARQCKAVLDQAPWTDGRLTAGAQAARAKHNEQVPADHKAAQQVANALLDALGGNMRFVAAALPLKVLPPTFNRYTGGGTYGNHIDNAIRNLPGTPHKVRTDISATVFLTDPADYDGGELVIEDTYGTHQVKLPAGHMVLYPGTSLHRVTPVTRGARVSAFFWVQSMVRDATQRALLWELDTAIQALHPRVPSDPALVQLTGVYHNLLRQWAET
ncbi:MAG: Fe2+-dependent dioxygenase [Burkholderiales bacterium]|jgi:PKHD-type hydroxylase|nr:Fe2+-dependent dioxygenase [Burkholderiales bacterium]